MTQRRFPSQGPHAPFSWRLAQMLRAVGGEIWRARFGGASGHWRLVGRSVPDMRAALGRSDLEVSPPRAPWRHEKLRPLRRALPSVRPGLGWGLPRPDPPRSVRRGRGMAIHAAPPPDAPGVALDRLVETARIRCAGVTCHLALLRPEHDASFRCAGRWSGMRVPAPHPRPLRPGGAAPPLDRQGAPPGERPLPPTPSDPAHGKGASDQSASITSRPASSRGSAITRALG